MSKFSQILVTNSQHLKMLSLNLSNSIAGRMAGVVAVNRSGEPDGQKTTNQTGYDRDKRDYIQTTGMLEIKIPGAEVLKFTGTAAVDVNADGDLDILIGGNVSYGKLYSGRYDASQGQLLIGNGKGEFRATTKAESGLDLKGNFREIMKVEDKILFYQNDGSLMSYSVLSSKTD